ncbi:hypothetical protein GYMLUDRAFT_50377 [Collybiopsis luxurians FD-317 M1]|uniref:Shugoshin C-terminal domain-containing protein n=1 Tax=Collybiopsis luxurians FD-317 M1 TaxID=944289 RepID=A0A0D0CA81_9AGAR|nr:hypothetical protein GYMLUDRAFT_50377 [Collybiopsis luxurians FD-317 M1]
MSRRESRVSISARQNDALFEFENFKKKFLLANKHITKLNSTLSVRIEELNAQISTLYTENLRLRASEINLAAQLKREREKSRKVITETEAAVFGLTKHLGSLRQTFSIPEEAPSSLSSSPIPLRATQRPTSSADSPQSPTAYPRLSRPPTIPLIYEDDEPSDPTEDEDEVKTKARRKTKTKRLSASRLPLPARISSPPPPPTIPPPIAILAPPPTKRKPLRRQSGLLVRPGSPVVGSTEAEEEDEIAAALGEPEEEQEPAAVKKEKRKSSKEKGKEREHEVSLRKKLRDEMGNERKKLKLADVTNSPGTRPSQPVDSVVSEVELEVARPSPSKREFLSSSPPRSSSSSRSSPNNYPPSTSTLQVPGSTDDTNLEPEPAPDSGRERRVRKSVNYAEPKLNTKMRKPEPEPGTTSTASRKRKSASAVMSSRNSEERTPGHEADADGNDETDGGARSSLEGPAPQLLRPPPPKSRIPAVSEPAQLPLPVSRPSSSAEMLSSATASQPSIRRSKSRTYIYTEDGTDDESDDADTEYVPSGKSVSSWVNMSERKKGGKKGVGSKRGEDDGNGDEAGRRHSSLV